MALLNDNRPIEPAESLVRELAAARRTLRDSRLLLLELAHTIENYQRELEIDIEAYRGQRAWKLMLAIRVLYNQMFCLGWRGRFQLLTRFPRLLSAKGLESMQLSFPKLSQYVPGALHQQIAQFDPDLQHPSLRYPQQKTDYIIFPVVDFHFRFQRPQQLARQWAQRGHRIFWINPGHFLAAQWPIPYNCRRLEPSIFDLSLRGDAFDIYLGELTPATVEQYLEAFRQFYRDFAISDSVLIVQLPCWRRLVEALRAEFGPLVVYDCMDDWESFQHVGGFARSEEPALARDATLLLVTAERLKKKFAARGLEPVLVRNAVDLDFYRASTAAGLLGNIPRPIAGFFGAIAEWFDLELMEQVARSRPQYSFVLIGEVYKQDVSRLQSLSNVHLPGAQPYERIPGYLRDFDACLIPFRISDVTRATDPVKLYEYFAYGKPVVSTQLEELHQCSDLLYMAASAPEFASRLDAAIAESDPGLVRRRIEFAAANTWSHRAGAIEEAIRLRSPLISVLIVTYDSAEFVGPCLDSIRRHTSYANYEVVIVDNASTDATPELCRQFAANDPRIRFFALDTNRGFAGGNNYAAAHAAGEFVVLLNADTMVTSGWLTRLRNHLLAGPSVGLVCAVTNFSGNETKVSINCANQQQMEWSAMERATDFYRQSFELTMAPLFCVMVRKSLFDELGGLDERYGAGMFEDDDFSFKARRAGKRVIAAEDCYVHHFGQGSFSQLSSDRYQELFDRNRQAFEEKWGVAWTPHRSRPDVRPAHLERRIPPAEFCTRRPPGD
ncbi:MAG: glycosyltransferase [Bryobacterales bacterium]|nr:glycosyltransferase [Bryobacterales bacterium]